MSFDVCIGDRGVCVPLWLCVWLVVVDVLKVCLCWIMLRKGVCYGCSL